MLRGIIMLDVENVKKMNAKRITPLDIHIKLIKSVLKSYTKEVRAEIMAAVYQEFCPDCLEILDAGQKCDCGLEVE